MKIKIRDLQIGDIVALDFSGGFNHAMVKNKTEKEVILYRPYLARPTFTYTGGAIMLTGHETINYSIDSNTEFELVEKGAAK